MICHRLKVGRAIQFHHPCEGWVPATLSAVPPAPGSEEAGAPGIYTVLFEGVYFPAMVSDFRDGSAENSGAGEQENR